MPHEVLHQVDVARDHAIGRHHDLCRIDLVPLFMPVQAVQHQGLQVRRRIAWPRHQLWTRLVGTTTRQGSVIRPCSCSNAICASVCAVLPRPMSSARMPAHVICGEALKPRQTRPLIVAQLALEAGGYGDLRQNLVVAQLAQEGFDLAGLIGPARHQIVDIDQQIGFGQWHLKLFVQPASAVQHRLKHAEQALHPFRRQRQNAPVVKHKLRLAIDDLGRRHAATVDQAGQDRQQRPALAVDLDTDIHVEPALAGIAHHDSDLAVGSIIRVPKSEPISIFQPSFSSTGTWVVKKARQAPSISLPAIR